MYQEPVYNTASFTCPHCDVVTAQDWHFAMAAPGKGNTAWAYALCQSTDCHRVSLWVGGSTTGGGFGDMVLANPTMVWPPHRVGPRAAKDMPDDVANIYNEARTVLPHSPRAAGALLRLSLQVLMPHVGQPGKDLNSEIADLVNQGLNPRIQKALDAVRIIGNDSVHPGQIDTDDHDTVLLMFDLMNQLVYDLITRDRKMNEVWERIPEAKREQVKKRDGRDPEPATDL